MAVPVSLFFRKQGYTVGMVKFDLILTENHEVAAEVTSHTVENGSVISDHIRNSLRRGSLSGMVSNFSITQPVPELPLVFQAKLATNRKITSSDVPEADVPENRARQAWAQFVELWNARTPVDIVTGVEKYKNVVVTSVTTDRQAGTGDALQFRVSFQQVKVVRLREVNIDTATSPLNMSNNDARQAAAKKDAGRTTTKAGAGKSNKTAATITKRA